MEKEAENKEEDLNKIKYYKIEAKKKEELEKAFREIKTRIKLNKNLKEQLNRFYSKQGNLRLPEIIFDIKQGKNNNNICIIYDKNSSKATEIEIPSTTIFVERLDNKDLIFVDHNGFNYELLVYRLMSGKKNEKKGYFLNQKIKETIEGFKIKYEYITPLNGPIG